MANWIRDTGRHCDFDDAGVPETAHACKLLCEARALRRKYQGGGIHGDGATAGLAGITTRFDASGILMVEAPALPTPVLCCTVSVAEFAADFAKLEKITREGAVRTLAHRRLKLLELAFETHSAMTAETESSALNAGPQSGADIFTVAKVDNHIHLAAASSSNQFADFVRCKLKEEPDTVVLHEEGREQTLQAVFEEAKIDPEHFSIDAFNVLADYTLYQRFDRFNERYSPWRLAKMRKIFLKSDNDTGGRFFAELTRRLLDRLERKAPQIHCCTELRISIYGTHREEWPKLAHWVLKGAAGAGGGEARPLLSSANRWLIQVPRLYSVFRSKKRADGTPVVARFSELVENIFSPLLEATLHPEAHPELAEFLKHVVGFDSVDDESNAECPVDATPPAEWCRPEQPNFSWQLYVLWGNLQVLNRLRAARGLNTWALRPHAGESGDPSHLSGAYLCATSINHGIRLDQSIGLQYLYYLDHVGLSISPLSNHFLFLRASDSPFGQLFRRGLHATLSTDDPMFFHLSDDPLLEEYSTARIQFGLSVLDLCEIARNSVLQSGFEDCLKRAWLGEGFESGALGCDPGKCNVTPRRAAFRAEQLAAERQFVREPRATQGPLAPTRTVSVM
jgi:AMP deaminase